MNLIKHNLPYKLLALAVSLILWTYVNSERNPQVGRTIEVPIQKQSLASGYVAETHIGEAKITIRGLKSVVDSVRKEDVEAWVDLGELRPDNGSVTKTVPVKVRVADYSEGELEFTWNPKDVEVTVESLSFKRLPVEIKFLTAAPLGYAYGDPRTNPASVGVSGKSTQVSKVERVVLTLPKETPDSDISGTFDVKPMDKHGRVVSGVNLEPGKVRLELSLVEQPATKEVIVSPNIVGEPEYPSKVEGVSVSPVSVTLEGDPKALMAMSTVSTEPVSIEGATTTFSKDVRLKTPNNVKVIGRSRVKVTVSITGPFEE